MISVLASLVATAPLVPPTLPPLCSPEFQNQVLGVERALAKADYTKAAELAKALPKLEFVMQWDDRKVPAKFRAQYRMARDRAVQLYSGEYRVKCLRVPSAPSGADLKISFEPVLADDPDTGQPSGAVFFDSIKRPRIEGVIGLNRGNPAQISSVVDVYNDTLFLLGTYYGMAKNTAPSSSMTPGIAGHSTAHGFSAVERVAIKQNLNIIGFLHKAIKEKHPVVAEKPDLFLDPASFEGDVIQGEVVELPIQITNRGRGRLSYRIEGDCGCILPGPPDEILPESSRVVKIGFDTKEYSVRTKRTVRIYTNDLTRPVVEIPVDLNIAPRYRFLTPGGTARNLDDGNAFDVYMVMAPNSEDMGIRDARVTGVDAKVTYEPWEGSLPDPERGEPDRPRKGYKFHVTVNEPIPPGRSLIGLDVATKSIEFPSLTNPMSIQRGVVAMPEELFMGELTKLPKKATVVVTRPGRELKVISATVSAQSMKVQVIPGKTPSEVRVQVQYDGSAPKGDLFATVTLKLDDAKQPTLMIPVSATVR